MSRFTSQGTIKLQGIIQANHLTKTVEMNGLGEMIGVMAYGYHRHVNRYALIEQVQWEPFHEGQKLQEVVETYRDRYGYYPEAVLADKL